MCRRFGVCSVIELFVGLIQSIIWIGFGVVGVLVYLCVMTVPPYKFEGDFFRVTIVKLYFEGPSCRLDGSYLGQFNNDYRNPDKIKLFTPDKVFALMITYILINIIYFILTIMCFANRNPKSVAQAKKQKEVAIGWSLITFLLCAIDIFVLYKFISDSLSITNYLLKIHNFDKFSHLPNVSLLMGLVSCRFGLLWLWNFIVAIIMLCRAFKFKYFEEQPVMVQKVVEVEKKPEEPISFVNGNYSGSFDLKNHADTINYKHSMEAVTRFSDDGSRMSIIDGPKRWHYGRNDVLWSPYKNPQGKEHWDVINESYEDDEQILGSEKNFDFDHDPRNFEAGRRKIKFKRAPLGKPVSIPVPPPFPSSSSCKC